MRPLCILKLKFFLFRRSTHRRIIVLPKICLGPDWLLCSQGFNLTSIPRHSSGTFPSLGYLPDKTIHWVHSAPYSLFSKITPFAKMNSFSFWRKNSNLILLNCLWVSFLQFLVQFQEKVRIHFGFVFQSGRKFDLIWPKPSSPSRPTWLLYQSCEFQGARKILQWLPYRA